MRLVYRRRALAQIEAILARIAEDNIRAAEKVFGRIEAIAKLITRSRPSAA